MLKPTRLTASLAVCALTVGVAGALGGATASAGESTPPPAPTGKAAAVAAADRAAVNGLDTLRHGPGEDLVRKTVTPWSKGLYFTSYTRTYHGLPVAGGDAVVLSDSKGRIRDISAAKAPEIHVSTHPKTSARAAEATARRQLRDVQKSTTPKLTVLIKSGKALLTWRTTVTGETAKGLPSARETYVDARTGKVAESREKVRDATGHGYHNGDVDITTSGSAGSYRMVDPTRSGLQCGGQNGAPYTSSDNVWGNGSPTDMETACVDVMYAAQKEFDMLRDWTGRNGQNGNGGLVPARVGLAAVNAYYDGTKTTFGHNAQYTRELTSIDVVAHEYGHNVFDTTPGGSGNSNEMGGMNESTGDVFGATTEFYADNASDRPDFTVGEKVDFNGNGRSIRYMYNPSIVGHPNCYNQLTQNTEVHAGAGPQNHWYYLLAEGSNPTNGQPASPICSGGPSSVQGIGVQKAVKIFMGALMMKTSYWTHPAMRRATLSVAKSTYGAAECNAVKAAWNAIAVPPQSGETDCGSTNANDFSLSLNPTSGNPDKGTSATATVGTTTTAGSAQIVALTASGQPSGVTVSFSPTSVTSGGSSTMTVAVGADTADGTYPITVKGTGDATGAPTHTVTYTLTVGTNVPPTGCDNTEQTYRGTLSSGQSEAQPDGSYYYSAASGTHIGCLRGPSGTDFDLYLQKWSGYSWVTVAQSTSPEENEDTTYNGTAGYYRYVVDAYAGSGSYTLGLSAP